MRTRTCALLGTVIALLMPGAPAARATTVQEIARLQGRGDSVLRGIGLVVGLPGTGDSGKEAALARPLAQLHAANGNPIGSLKDLTQAKAVAVVVVTCSIPETGARTSDRFDVSIAALHNATSLKGGRLFLAPLSGPYVGDDVYAVAEGPVDLEDPGTPTVGRVRSGARITKDILMPELSDTFDVVLLPHFAGLTCATEVALQINAEQQTTLDPTAGPIAEVIDERTIRVTVPPSERGLRPSFIADVMGTPVNPASLGLPAMVICNQRTGSIVMTADVQISPVVITHQELTITTTTPAPVPTQRDPLVERTRWTKLGTPGSATAPDAARLQSLLDAFKTLEIPASQQIEILHMLAKGGQLQARLVID